MDDLAEMFDQDLTQIFALDYRVVAATLEHNGDILDDAEDAAAFWHWLEDADDDLEALNDTAKQIILGQYKAWSEAGRPR